MPAPDPQHDFALLQQQTRRMYERWLTGWARDYLVCRALKKRSKSIQHHPSNIDADWSSPKLSSLLGDY